MRTPGEAIEVLEADAVSVISLDFDLNVPESPDATGRDVLVWIERRVLGDADYSPPEIRLHSANRFGCTQMNDIKKRIQKEVILRSWRDGRELRC